MSNREITDDDSPGILHVDAVFREMENKLGTLPVNNQVGKTVNTEVCVRLENLRVIENVCPGWNDQFFGVLLPASV